VVSLATVLVVLFFYGSEPGGLFADVSAAYLDRGA
jgi:hypothetical protein